MVQPAVILLWQDFKQLEDGSIKYAPSYHPAILKDDDNIEIIDNQGYIEETTAMLEAIRHME